MPRPGPRPYECVRRAWHSERHQPIRGSIIQHIFRVVNETHSCATKKNKEWQEKLPIVALRAEEIMYSKANSEAEYLNPDTVWERLNDAINTIIRRDDSTETGELLPPCVEAALNLGCKPVRASRSERHNTPRTYLTPRTQEPASGSPKIIGELGPQFFPLQSGNPLSFAIATTSVSALPVSNCSKHVNLNNKLMTSGNYPFSHSFPRGHHQPLFRETNMPLKLGSVYPLYHGTHYESKEPQRRITTLQNSCSETIFVGRPIITPTPDPARIGLLQSVSYSRSQHVSKETAKEIAVDIQENSGERECDLSLRLGLCLQPFSSSEKSSACETEDVHSRGSQEGGKIGRLSLHINEDFYFYPRKAGYDTLNSNSTRYKSEDQNLEATFRKLKTPLGNHEEDAQFCRQLGVPSNRFTGRIQGPSF